MINLQDPASATPATNTFAKYRKVVAYDEVNGILTVDKPWADSAFADEPFYGEIAYPTKAYLPHPDYSDASPSSAFPFAFHSDSDYNLDPVIPQDHLDKADLYQGMFVRVTQRVLDPSLDEDISLFTQTRRIQSYDPTTGIVTIEGEWDDPPTVAHTVGIVPTFVDLNYLARMVGWTLESDDPEELQRQQILNAINFYKFKGTFLGYQLLFRTYGFDIKIKEQQSNYTHAPETYWNKTCPTNTIAICDDPHTQVTSGVDIGDPPSGALLVPNPNYYSGTIDENTTGNTLFTDGFTVGTDSQVDFTNYYMRAYSTATGAQTWQGLAETGLDLGSGIFIAEVELFIDSLSMNDTERYELLSFGGATDQVTLAFVSSGGVHTNIYVGGTGTAAPDLGGATGTDTGYDAPTNQRIHLRFVVKAGTASDGFVEVYAGQGMPRKVFGLYDITTVDTTTITSGTVVFGARTLAAVPGLSYDIRFHRFVTGCAKDDEAWQTGLGVDDTKSLTGTLYTDASAGNTNLRIPDSDILLYLTPFVPGISFDIADFDEIARKVEVVRPIHVEVGLVGQVAGLNEPVAISDSANVVPSLLPAETVNITADAVLSGNLRIVEGETVTTTDIVTITTPVRWNNRSGDRYTSRKFKGWTARGILFKG